jgi:hypothetical protein
MILDSTDKGNPLFIQNTPPVAQFVFLPEQIELGWVKLRLFE